MKDLILLSSKVSAALRWVPPTTLSFLSKSPLIPIQASEIGKIGSVFSVAIVRDESQSSGWALMAVCGVSQDSNAYVGPEGRWHAPIAPESIRWLPFTLRLIGSEKAVTAIDTRYARDVLVVDGVNGVPMYSANSTLHPTVQSRIEHLKKHHGIIRRTQNILSQLSDAGVLQPWPTQALSPGNITLEGLHTIDEKKLSQLDDKVFLTLRKSGALAVAYSCLLSLYQIRNLVNKAGEGKPVSDKAVQTTGDIDLEFLNDSETIKFGPMQ